MKTAPSKSNRILAYLRFSAGAAFFAAAAALAFVAATTNVMTAHDVAATKPLLSIGKASMQTRVGGANIEYSDADGSIGLPTTAAEAEAMKRAYPADSTPFSAQMNSVSSFKRFMATSASTTASAPATKGRTTTKNKKQPPEAPRFNTWQMLGPSTATFPSILTFSGAAYNTSGRITAIAIDRASGCTTAFCRTWIGAAGGGVWRTTNALATTPTWTFLGTPGPTNNGVPSNAIGALTYDNQAGLLYVGTGEPNASADSEAGMGIYRSSDGGDTWAWLPSSFGPWTSNSPGSGSNGTYSGNAFFGRGIASIVIDPTNHAVMYVSSTRALRGVNSTYGGPTSNPPVPRPPFGLFKSTNGGYNFTFIWDGGAGCPGSCQGGDPFASIRGVTDVRLDPLNHNMVYASTFPGPAGGGGLWRSADGGTTWAQILPALTPADNVDRVGFDVANIGGGNTMIIAGDGNDGAASPQVFRSLNANTAATFVNLTAAENPSRQTDGYCTSQCWYDNYVVIPPEAPNIAYLGGSNSYYQSDPDVGQGGATNGRAVIATQTANNPVPANVTWFDFTWDATNTPGPSCCNPTGINPNGMHPDSHALATLPGFPTLFFAGSDGGIVRSVSGYSDITAQCTSRIGVTIFTLHEFQLCSQMLMAVPNLIGNMNSGLKTLQFMSVDYAENNPFHVQGGTQDNGTLETFGSLNWNQIIYGDGGQSGINSANSFRRFNTFFFQQHDVNFQNGDPTKWVVVGGQIFNDGVLSQFYPAIIRDPTFAAANTIFEGTRHVWRTQDWGGSQAFLETNCPEFTAASTNPACGDFIPLGGPAGTNTLGDLGGTPYGADRRPTSASRLVEEIARTTANTNVAWASTDGGRVFISTNVDANPGTVPPNFAGSVVWKRLDSDSGAAPGAPVGTSADPSRVPTGIAIDPTNNFHAWISYSGYNFNTPNQPGHVFSVTWDGVSPTATWTNISNNLPDIPYTSIVFDPVTGDLYVSSDFTVFRLAANQQNGQHVWDVAGIGLPIVEVPRLTINPGQRVLYAATHGLSAWALPLY
jgi:hypothetical protein